MCDDDNVCTTASCNKTKGCAQTDNTELCTDGNICTTADRCKAGKCEAGANTCVCEKDADCASKEDGNLCNGTLYCDKAKAPFACKVNPKTVVNCTGSGAKCKKNVCAAKTGKCSVQDLPNGTNCDADGSVCTTLDTCKAGTCTAGNPLPCNDGKICTNDSCNPTKGCLFSPNASKCDADGSVCTVDDSCVKGICLAGPKKKCDDGNDCTDDSCDSGKGCQFAANSDACDDNSACTKGDICAASKCVGSKVSCDDNDPCTADSCNSKSGCGHKSAPGSCEDGDACTDGDKCAATKGGKWGCTAGDKKNCDDGNVCTIDGCHPAKGCTKKADVGATHACYGGSKGTAGVGTCAKGKASCKADGTMGSCVGEVVPAKSELCDGKDDTCDGKTDEGCKAERATVGFGATSLRAAGGSYEVRAWTGGSASIGGSMGPKQSAWWGFDRWLRTLGKSK